MIIVLLLLPTVVAISSLAAGYFTGFGKTISASIQQPGFSFALTSFVLITSFLLGIKLNVYAAYISIASGLSFIGLYRILRGTGDNLTVLIKAPQHLKKSIYRLALRYSRQYLVINFFTTFSSVYFISFLALFVASDLIGQFKVVERLAMVIAFNLTFVNIILPARAISQRLANDHTQFDRSMRLTFLFQYATGLGVFFIYLVFMNQIMEWIEVDNWVLYILLLAAQLINALTGPVRVILMYLNGQHVLQVSAILETCGSAFLYWILYNAYGLTGLAIGYVLAISLPNIVLAWIVYTRFGIIPIPFVSPVAGSRK
jgi:O-antigen/teichoic acid export membrane protein